MNLSNITYHGPKFLEDEEIISLLPENLLTLLKLLNGFIQYGGGLHVRGICTSPEWHSLKSVTIGKTALHKHYPTVLDTDIPFAQDCVADQYLLRDATVYKLHAETSKIECLDLGLASFFETAAKDPIKFLGMEPLLQLQKQEQKLEPGQVIHVWPPFCTEEAQNGVSLKPVNINDALVYLSDFSKQIKSVGDGEQIEIHIVE